MAAIEESIEVLSPLRAVYDRWTQFEDFPNFMKGVTEVRQLDETHLHWVAELAGHRHEWDAVVTEQKPDERVAWKNVDGKDNAGVVTFHRIDEGTTKVMVQMDFVPDGIVEKLGNALGAADRRIKGDLERFKELVESNGAPTEGWRGEVKRPDES
ncbi:MAG: SRPBCC family protein [Solirubrobacteraceae bacterium]